MSYGRRPKTDAEWAREVERRLSRLENPRSVRMGDWQISVSPVSGNLVADYVPTGRRVTLAVGQDKDFYEGKGQ